LTFTDKRESLLALLVTPGAKLGLRWLRRYRVGHGNGCDAILASSLIVGAIQGGFAQDILAPETILSSHTAGVVLEDGEG